MICLTLVFVGLTSMWKNHEFFMLMRDFCATIDTWQSFAADYWKMTFKCETEKRFFLGTNDCESLLGWVKSIIAVSCFLLWLLVAIIPRVVGEQFLTHADKRRSWAWHAAASRVFYWKCYTSRWSEHHFIYGGFKAIKHLSCQGGILTKDAASSRSM